MVNPGCGKNTNIFISVVKSMGTISHKLINKSNLRDLIAATDLVILLKLDSNRRFFKPCDLEIWWMTSKDHKAPPLYYIKLCASSQTSWWIQTGVLISDLLSRVTMKFDGWPWNTIGHLFYATLRFLHHFKAISEFKLELQSRNTQFRSKSAIFCPMWPWNSMDDLDKQ